MPTWSVQKLRTADRLRLSKADYKSYIANAVANDVIQKPDVPALKSPVMPQHPIHKVTHSAAFTRLGMTAEEYREEVFNQRTKKTFQEPTVPKKESRTITHSKKFNRLAMSSEEYKKASKEMACNIESLKAPNKIHSVVTIPGRNPLSDVANSNFSRLSTTRQIKREAALAKLTVKQRALLGRVSLGLLKRRRAKKRSSIVETRQTYTHKPGKVAPAQIVRHAGSVAQDEHTTQKPLLRQITGSRAEEEAAKAAKSKCKTLPMKIEKFDRLSMSPAEYREWRVRNRKAAASSSTE